MHSYKEDNRPSFQFYPDDWISETGLRLCSLAAKGLWIDMLCIMFYNKPRGLLIANGLQIDNKMLSKIMGEKEEVITSLLQELEGYKIFSRRPDGTIYSRRMYNQSIKETRIKELRSEAGKKGMQKRWKKSDNKKITKITTSSSTPTSSSTSIKKESNKEREKDFLKELQTYPQFSTIIKEFFNYWTEPNKSKTKMRFEQQKTWDTKRRLQRWADNAFGNKAPNRTAQIEKERQAEERKRKKWEKEQAPPPKGTSIKGLLNTAGNIGKKGG